MNEGMKSLQESHELLLLGHLFQLHLYSSLGLFHQLLPLSIQFFFEILKREKIIKNENKTCKDMYMICYTIYTHRHMRQEDNGPNLFTLLKEDIFKDDLHLEGVLMEYCTCNSFQRKCSPV